MRLRTARRPRLLAAALAVLTCACADDGPVAQPIVVRVAAQPCDRPTRSHGLGFVVARNLVATAAHTVEGDLRELTVDDVPATVVAIDPRTDVALLEVGLPAPPADLSTGTTSFALVLEPAQAMPVRVLRTGTLVVHDTTDRARYERQAHTFTPGVEHGASGAPLVDASGRVLGVVVIDNPRRGVAYAVTAAELSRLLPTSRDPTNASASNCAN
jgi:S1-C subfamily serine protease